jgi:hypothetical protein
MCVGGVSPLRAVMVGTARAGQGVHREVESEGSRSPKLGLDEQESDRRPDARGHAAMDADAQPPSGRAGGKSGEARGKDASLNLGGLMRCSGEPNYDRGDTMGRRMRSQPRP